MARKCETIFKKTTSSGIQVTLVDNTVTKIYSRTSKVFMMFRTHKEAKREFNKHRQGYKQL